jgi:hypothetical protein
MVHGSIGISSTKTVATEEKPLLEIDELKQLPNNVAIVLPSNGDRTLAATITYLRPLWIRKKYPDLTIETPWLDWPQHLRTTYDLDNIPQELNWKGWDVDGPLDEDDVVESGQRLGRFVQAAIAEPSCPVVTPPTQPEIPTEVAEEAAEEHEDDDDDQDGHAQASRRLGNPFDALPDE